MPRAEHPGPRELARYQREFNLLRHLEGTPGVPRAIALLESSERPVLQRRSLFLSGKFADKHKVLQILLNLLSNAWHSRESVPLDQRLLQIRLVKEKGFALLQVIDSGRGLSPEHLPRLFTRGFTTRKGGHGLGLHFSALAAQLPKGRLTLQRPGPHLGATATLALPLLAAGVDGGGAEPLRAPPGSGLR